MRYLKKFKVSFIGLSILYILLGIMLILWPQISLAAICKLLGVVVLVFGVVRAISYFANEDFRGSLKLSLAQGLLNILLGLFMLISPGALVKALPIVLGIAIIVDSMLRVQLAVELKMNDHNRWWIDLILALVTTIFGAILVFNPFTGSIILGRFLGISLTINGITNMWVLFSLSKRLKSFHEIEQKYWDM